MVKKTRIIKVKGAVRRRIDPADFAKAMGAEQIKLDPKKYPMSLFALRQGLMDNTPAQLACDITERLFGEAPLHLRRPQAAELSKFTLGQLQVIAQIKSFPIPKRLRNKIIAELGNEELIKRMEKRWRIAKTIHDAEKEGLYEAAENVTGILLSQSGAKALFELIDNPPKLSPALKRAMRLREQEAHLKDIVKGITPENRHGEEDFGCAALRVKNKYIKCQKCGWIHFIEPSVDAPWRCFNCGNTDRKTLVKALKKEVPRGSTIQPINRYFLPPSAAKALFEPVESPSEPSQELKKALAEVNKRHEKKT